MLNIKYKTQLLVLIVCFSNLSNATTINIDNKVNHDLDMYRSFLSTSEKIELHEENDFVTIGADAGCDFNSAIWNIGDAISSGSTEVRVASNGTYIENIVLDDQDLILRGGFATCSDAELNNQDFMDFTEINGSAVPSNIIAITGNATRRLIRLENLLLTGASVTFPTIGGALSVIQANLELQLLRVFISGNSGGSGAGIYINPGTGANQTNIDVFAQDLVVHNNSSVNLGGGLFCIGFRSQIALTGISTISNNTSATSGGGLSIIGHCKVSIYSKTHSNIISAFPGLFNNNSKEEGGGAFLRATAFLYLFGQRMCDDTHCLGSADAPIIVQGNSSDSDNMNNESGGGVYMDGTGGFNEFYANGIWINNNQSRGNGGGVYVGSDSIFEIERRPGGCWQKDRCNLIINNLSGTSIGLGGGIYVDGGTMNLSHVYMEENRADFGAAIAASGENAIVTIENSVFNDNGNSGADGFSDFEIIRASTGASISIRHSTFADNNAINTVFAVDPALNSSLSLYSSVVHDPDSGNLFGPVSGDLTINCLVSHEATSFTGLNVLVDDPVFVNRSLGNFHLAAGSPAIDLCSGIPMLNPLDMDMEIRAWDDPDQIDGMGIFDAGADERYFFEVIFIDGFEGF